jgi:dephospho-CoA kinase
MGNKKAIFVCGSGGSGKTTFVLEKLSHFHNVNVDTEYEKLLLENGLTLKIKNFTQEEKELSKRLFEEAKQITTQNLLFGVKNELNIVIDTIGRDSNLILNQRIYLESNGYDVFMIMLYASMETCLNRTENRERVYEKNLTIDSWYLSYGNLTDFSREFNEKFVLIFTENEGILNEKITDFIDGRGTIRNQKNKYL